MCTGESVLAAVGVSPTFTRSTSTTQYGFLLRDKKGIDRDGARVSIRKTERVARERNRESTGASERESEREVAGETETENRPWPLYACHHFFHHYLKYRSIHHVQVGEHNQIPYIPVWQASFTNSSLPPPLPLSPLSRRPKPQPSRLEHIDRQAPPHVEALLLDAELVSLRRPPAAAAAAPAAPLAAHVDAAAAGASAARRARPASLGGRLRTYKHTYTRREKQPDTHTAIFIATVCCGRTDARACKKASNPRSVKEVGGDDG